jgi:hypothetical protein
MIKIKLTTHGGYVVGDGKCPFDPDEFYILFASKMIDAKRRGLQELEISDLEIDAILSTAKAQIADEIKGAPIIEVKDKRKLLEVLE